MPITDREQEIINTAAQTGFAADAAERVLIGSIIENYDRCAHLVSELRDDDFYYEVNRKVFKAIKHAKEKGLSIDLITIDQEVQKIDQQNNGKILQHMIQAIQEAAWWNADSYCQIVKELAARRRAIALIGKIEQELKDPTNTVNGILDRLRSSTGDLMVGGHKWVSMGEVLMNTYANIERRVKGEIVGIESGIHSVDGVIGGFFGGELTIVGARPGVGKSVFGMNAALAAAKKGFKVGICSREMSDIQYGQRVLSYASGVNGMKLRKAQVEDDDWVQLAACLSETSALPISNEDFEALTALGSLIGTDSGEFTESLWSYGISEEEFKRITALKSEVDTAKGTLSEKLLHLGISEERFTELTSLSEDVQSKAGILAETLARLGVTPDQFQEATALYAAVADASGELSETLTKKGIDPEEFSAACVLVDQVKTESGTLTITFALPFIHDAQILLEQVDEALKEGGG